MHTTDDHSLSTDPLHYPYPNNRITSIWSITPAVYAWVFALHPLLALGEGDPADLPFDRPTVMAALTTLWCAFFAAVCGATESSVWTD